MGEEKNLDETKAAWYDASWPFRLKLVIDHNRVAGDLVNFPVLVAVTEPGLRPAVHRGYIDQLAGPDIIFSLADGRTLLEWELEKYVAGTGEIKAWVKLPLLVAGADTIIYMYYGRSGEKTGHQFSRAVWNDDHGLVLHLLPAGPTCRDSTARQQPGRVCQTEAGTWIEVEAAAGLYSSHALTVETWVESGPFRPESLQVLVSQWALQPTLAAFDAHDAGRTDGLATVGYFGAVFDGRYIYFAPAYDGSANHGRVLRYDTHAPFHEDRSWSAYDAGSTSGLSCKGYYGGVFDGRYVYFVPRLDRNFTPDAIHHSRVLRYDTTGDFKDAQSWHAFDAGNRVSSQGAAFDGRYIYFCPGYEHVTGELPAGSPASQWPGVVPSGKVLRYDTRADFADPGSYTTYDASGTDGLDTRCYDGAVFDGRYIYFVPLESQGVVLRYDVQGDFARHDSWAAYNARHTSGLEMGWSVGAIFDGRYVYIVPYSNGVVVRYDTAGEFRDPANWLAYDAGYTAGLNTTGYDGAIFDGRYVYFIPFHQGSDSSEGFHATVLRYDTQGAFTNPASWNAADAAATAGLNPVGFNGGAFDGRYFYCAPWRDGLRPDGRPAAHGRVLRYDTTGCEAAFSLRYADYGHNGGLTGAAPGPSFLVNTDRGVLSVAAHVTLPPGWHQLVGVYDGATISLFIDGVRVAERAGTGAISVSDTPLVIGRTHNGRGYFGGQISEVRLSYVARSPEWLQTTYHNLAAPAAFMHIEAIERNKIDDN